MKRRKKQNRNKGKKRKDKYQKIINELVKKSFPELKGKKIILGEFASKNYGGGAFKFLGIRVLFINKKLRKINTRLLKGLISHELCHLEYYEKISFLKHIWEGVLYWIISLGFRKKDEQDTDKNAIKKGYARELYDYRRYIFKFRKGKVKQFYMTPEQIKQYAKKIGKW